MVSEVFLRQAFAVAQAFGRKSSCRLGDVGVSCESDGMGSRTHVQISISLGQQQQWYRLALGRRNRWKGLVSSCQAQRFHTSMSVLLPELVHLLWCTWSDVCFPSKVRFSIVVLGLRAKVRYSRAGSSAVESRWFRTPMVVPFRFGFRHFRSNAHK